MQKIGTALRSVLLILFTAAGLLFTSASPARLSKQTVTYVYICDSEGSVAYHSSKDCRGLQKCTHDILKVTEDEAVNKYNRRQCKICY